MSSGVWRAGEFGLLALLLAIAGGCAAMVSPPAKLADPVPIYFAQYNIHSTILLPDGGRYIDYSFGDWNYAALHHKFINDAVGALTISFDSAFERREVLIDRRSGEPILNDNPDLVIRLYADRQAVRRRVAELERRFLHDEQLHRTDGMVVYNDQLEVFVKDAEHYSLIHNCNNLTAETLRDLGYRVDGLVMSNNFHVIQPQLPLDSSVINATLNSP